MIWWYMSFADENGWLGGCHVQGQTFDAAVKRAWNLGINPGEEIKGLQCPNDYPLPEWAKNKLLNRADMARLNREQAN